MRKDLDEIFPLTWLLIGLSKEITEIIAVNDLTVKTKKKRFGKCYTCLGRENKTGVVCILVNFEDRPMFSHIIQNVSARAFLRLNIHRSMLKKYKNTHQPRFSFIPKTGIAFPKTGGLILRCCSTFLQKN